MWPLQSRNSVANVRFVFGVLKAAFKQAASLELIGKIPLAEGTFNDFIKSKIKPKDARLRLVDCGRLLEHWAARYRHETTTVALAVLILAHGTRIDETRQAGRAWHIPAVDTKTKKAHTLPLTAQACAFLTRYRASQTARPYLFPGAHGQPLSETPTQLAFVALAGEEWISHDLRKATHTAWADLGVDYPIGELLLNHTPKTLDVTYIHTSAEAQKRQALKLACQAR
ncbi:tyrosine-type recombinase/integrase [Pseudomonas chlororaphis]|uniref:tyrosine-type recombinase/integrase n=1 Tax=Pseudomonas chlororaphis TaxID=587753 RepID=UPI00131A567B|nr:tyrosine-type recombinase/integrase [Pseudomonas chlororaphis]